MLIATSLMYSTDEWEIEKQKKAMGTWENIGFRIISCNVKEEIEVLRKVFPKVFFVELKRSGKEKTGKPFPYIYDMLQILSDHVLEEKELCGIINSDIFLKNISEEEIREHFVRNEKKVLIMHRYDIDNENDRAGEYYFSGVDAFFFQNNYISNFPDKGFMLGRPEWDHWFLYEASHAGMQILEIKNKIAFHIKHRQRWSAAESNTMVSNQMKEQKVQAFDEEYYYCTNEIMANLQNRVSLNGTGVSGEELLIEKDGFYMDAEREQLIQWENTAFQTENIPESIGVIYFKNNKPYRICAAHREVLVNLDGTFSLGSFFEKEKGKGCILKYVDFKDFDFVKKLGRFYVYPAGRASRLLVDCLNTYQIPILGMVDRDQSLCGKTYKDKEIFNLSVLENKDSYDHVLIVSNLYVKEIYDSLSKMIKKEKLIVL